METDERPLSTMGDSMGFTQLPTDPLSEIVSVRGELMTDQAPRPIGGEAAEGRDGAGATIWGTTVNAGETMRDFAQFVQYFHDPASISVEPIYMAMLQRAAMTGEDSLALDAQHLHSYQPALYFRLVRYPQEVIGLFDRALLDLLQYSLAMDAEELDRVEISVRPFNLSQQQSVRTLDPSDIDQLVSLRGMVTRTSNIIPDMHTAAFRCGRCDDLESRRVERGRIREPEECAACHEHGTMLLIHNECGYHDRQLVKLQEAPESVPDGETPQSLALFAYRALVDVARPGDRVEVTGIYRASAVAQSAHRHSVRAVYRTYIDIVHVARIESSRNEAVGLGAGALSSASTLTVDLQETERRIRQIARQPGVYERLARSLAPSVWELDDLKKGVLCLLFGGVPKEFRSEAVPRSRGEIHVLLCGDPSTSKSQMLGYVHKIAPRGIYTSGKGSSAVGLTAYITRDPDTGQTVLESGALVLSDRGVCCIDEFDKMSDHTRSILHEAMEQQTVSVAKAGIICTLNSRSSILASANPVESRYNPTLSVVDNLHLPPTLLSRFDLIFLVLDKPSADSDRRLAEHMVSLYFREPGQRRRVRGDEPGPAANDDLIPVDMLTRYIAYARENVEPRLTDAAARELELAYVEMRRVGAVGGRRVVTATPRQLESMVRLSEALARMRLSDSVEVADVREARRLMHASMQSAAMDPTTGTIDMDLIHTGRSSTRRDELRHIADSIRQLLVEQRQSLTIDDISTFLSRARDARNAAQRRVEPDLPHSTIRDACQLLREEGLVRISQGRTPRISLTNIDPNV